MWSRLEITGLKIINNVSKQTERAIEIIFFQLFMLYRTILLLK